MKAIPQLIIRKLEGTDVDDILKIAEECNLAIWNRQDYIEETERKNSFIAGVFEKKKDDLRGFIAVRFHLSAAVESNQTEADILNIGVLRTYQKTGIGSLLFREFLMQAEKLKIRKVWLEVRKSNFNARKFYQRKNFVEVCERKNFYTQPTDDAVVMQLDLPQN